METGVAENTVGALDKTGTLDKICDEPYRVFFPLGWIAGLWGVGYWLAFGLGFHHDFNPIYHGLIQIELFCGAYAIGFLLTALPKFLRSRPPQRWELGVILGIFLVTSLEFGLRNIVAAQYGYLALLCAFFLFAVPRYLNRKNSPPPAFLLVALGWAMAGAGIFCFLFGDAVLSQVGRRILEQGFFLSLVMGVGSFLGPRLMGHRDDEQSIVRFGASQRSGKDKRALRVFGALGLLLLISFFVEGYYSATAGQWLRIVTVGATLLITKALYFPVRVTLVGVMCWLAFVAIIVGLTLVPCLPSDQTGALHLVFIGGFTLLIVAIATQVSASHGGVPTFWSEKGLILRIIVGALLLGTIFRVAAMHIPGWYVPLLTISAGLVSSALLVWGALILPLAWRFKEHHQSFDK